MLAWMDPVAVAIAFAIVGSIGILVALREGLELRRLRRLTGASSDADLGRRIHRLQDRVAASSCEPTRMPATSTISSSSWASASST